MWSNGLDQCSCDGIGIERGLCQHPCRSGIRVGQRLHGPSSAGRAWRIFIYVEKAIESLVTRMRFTQVQKFPDEMMRFINIVEPCEMARAH